MPCAVDADIRIGTERPREEILPRGDARLGRGEDAAIDQFLHLRMVTREHLEHACTQTIEARVADMGHIDMRRREPRCDHRRPHPRAVRFGARRFEDAVVGTLDRDLQPIRLERGQAAGGREQCLDGETARQIAGVVAAHAIGHHQQTHLGVDTDRILVALAHFADVRDTGALERPRYP